MKSANVLLELPATGAVLSAGTLVQAILISDISNFPLSKMQNSMDLSSFPLNPTIRSDIMLSQTSSEFQDATVIVAILTVSDTVAFGSGPDRRYAFCFPYVFFMGLLCLTKLFLV